MTPDVMTVCTNKILTHCCLYHPYLIHLMVLYTSCAHDELFTLNSRENINKPCCLTVVPRDRLELHEVALTERHTQDYILSTYCGTFSLATLFGAPVESNAASDIIQKLLV